MFRFLLPILAILALLVSGCQIAPAPGPSSPVPRSTATPAGRPPLTPSPASPSAEVATRPMTLTIWLPDTLFPTGNTSGNTLLTEQVKAFAATQTDVHIELLTKRAHGPGGILDLIQKTAPVASSVLPDAALIDLADVPAAAPSGIFQPLTGLVPDDGLGDLFPFAGLARFDNRWWAVAYATDMEHLVYNSARLSSPPITWGQIMSGSQPYVFPAGATGGMPADGLFAQYAAAGGRWVDNSGHPFLDAAALTQMLSDIKQAQEIGVIPANVLSLTSPDETWLGYLSSPAQIADVRASRFIAQRGVLSGTLAAPLPGRAEPARLIARGWAWVVPARDPNRAVLAGALVAWLSSPENEGAWTRAANLLPARRSALNHWFPPSAYTTFVQQELDRAIPPPAAEVAQVIGPAIQKAVADVLRNQAQPTEAATTAVAAVERAK